MMQEKIAPSFASLVDDRANAIICRVGDVETLSLAIDAISSLLQHRLKTIGGMDYEIQQLQGIDALMQMIERAAAATSEAANDVLDAACHQLRVENGSNQTNARVS